MHVFSPVLTNVSKIQRMKIIKYEDNVTNLWEHKLQIDKKMKKKNSEKSNETKKEEFIKKMKTYCKEISLIVNAIKRPKTIWLLCFSLLCW